MLVLVVGQHRKYNLNDYLDNRIFHKHKQILFLQYLKINSFGIDIIQRRILLVLAASLILNASYSILSNMYVSFNTQRTCPGSRVF